MIKIKTVTQIFLFIVLLISSCKNNANHKQITDEESYLKIVFEDSEDYQFNNSEKELIKKTAILSDQEIRKLLPSLTKNLTLRIIPVDYDLNIVGGVTGRTNTPHEVTAEISYTYKGGISAVVKKSLSGHIYHEFHHVWRGWTLSKNEFEKGISTAAINEGLADVFSKTYTGVYLKVGNPSDDIRGWTQEVLNLPKDADYNQWMNQHSDGRFAIGYRVGTYIVEQALKNTNMTIVELSNYKPEEILKKSGLKKY
ncbi:DUF2268 domain-containing putative Zn-dependent protease [Flagellimonas eckloniae]|uniref:DUF2268 domain-containing protein n=1 Tax=Flagellimonas eckloniae TaxID=346185 RepID=A0A0Q1BZH7_9FLAO|nr:DUF2268 domain-containing putative Zn-dependent protease [Allomuricauda eckloniae]KQC30231.1 hypothetical protein AAY42_10360 [Allomuricauda eckloniae]